MVPRRALCLVLTLLAVVLAPLPLQGQALARPPVNPLPTSRLLLEEAAPITAFDLDRGLTGLCRAGRFRQQRQHLFVVRLGGYLHGAVIGGAWGLYDPEGLAVPNLVYALRWQDTGRCEVRVIRHLPAGRAGCCLLAARGQFSAQIQGLTQC